METNDGAIHGTCQQMCSKQEYLMRERESLLHPLEVLIPDNDDKTSKSPRGDPEKVVKQFSRPAAGRADTELSDLRPAPVLRKTVAYLYDSIIPKDHPAWSSIYEFVFDRLRAVRQDMVIQGITGADAIGLLEQVVRFHLYASYRLRGADIAEFDPVINQQHLLECLKRLLYLYQVTPGPHGNRVEFESVYLLNNLGDTHAMTHYLDLSPELRKTQLLHQCYEISTAFVLRNYTRCLKMIWKLPCAMCLCAVNPHLEILRINFLQILSAGYSVKNCKFPVTELTKLLHTSSDNSTTDLCSRCLLIDMFDNESTEYICFNKTAFSRPKEIKAPSELPILDKILSQTSISSLLLGQDRTARGVKVDTDTKPKTGLGRGRGRGRGRGKRE